MRLGFTFLLAFLFIGFVGAQDGINDQSPFPADLVVLSPNSIAGTYTYGTQASDPDPEWGPRLSEDVQGELVWGFNNNDSLGCNTGGEIITDLTGKMAFIRRGACSFVEKVLNAQQAGAVGVVIVNHFDTADDTETIIYNMIAGDTLISDSVTIPAVFVNRADGRILQESVDAGESPEVLFDVKTFFDGAVAWSNQTPLDNFAEYPYNVTYVNPNQEDEVIINVTAVVTDPNGIEVATFTVTDTVDAAATELIVMDEGDFYQPTETGIYTVTFTHDQADETIVSTFTVTDNTFGSDGVNFAEELITVGPSQEQYNEGGGFYQSGSLIVTAEEAETTVGTHISFGLANPQDFFDPFTGGEEFELIVYQGLFSSGAAASFDDLAIVGGANYTIEADDMPNEILFVELEDPVVLDPDETYYVSVRKTAGLGSGLPPEFVASRDVTYTNFLSDDETQTFIATPLQLDAFFTGWASQTVWTRLHTDGFDPDEFQLDSMISSTNDIMFLDANQVVIAPNPVQEQLNVTLDLNNATSQAIVRILDVNGRVLGQYKFEQVTNAPIQIDVNNLQSGTYFLSVATPEGYRMKKFIKQ
ncbi:hypothetical protein CEQ90_04830 [Lewinellaceae bacterium SD302]|nr:hypothetical protein CEQ90_04830 [Lewinellaceae bacterium SD302]